MIKQTCKILALAALPLLLIPAAQADSRFAVRISDHDASHHSRDAGKGHHGYRKDERRDHRHGRRDHGHRASYVIVSPRAYATRDYDFGHRYVVIDRRHRHAGPVSGRFCDRW